MFYRQRNEEMETVDQQVAGPPIFRPRAFKFSSNALLTLVLLLEPYLQDSHELIGKLLRIRQIPKMPTRKYINRQPKLLTKGDIGTIV